MNSGTKHTPIYTDIHSHTDISPHTYIYMEIVEGGREASAAKVFTLVHLKNQMKREKLKKKLTKLLLEKNH